MSKNTNLSRASLGKWMPNLQGVQARWPGELISGLLVAVIALPLALAFGVSAFSPLGPGYGALGALAGLTGAALTGILASLFGGCAPQVTGPTGPMSVVARSTLATLLGSPAVLLLPEEVRPAAVLGLFSLSVVLGGLFQWLLAWSRLGALVRALPYPVVAGFMNGVSLLIIIGQIKPALGWPAASEWSTLLVFPWPPVMLIGLGASLITVLTILLLPKLTKAVPSSFVGLLVGTGVYYLAGTYLAPEVFQLASNPNVVGPIPSSIPLPKLLLSAGDWLPLLAEGSLVILVLQQAFIVGLLGAIDTLLTSVIADLRTGTRHNSHSELFGQGLGNMVSGLFGGLPGAGATVRTLVNVDNGGRTGLSGAFHGLVILGVMVVLSPWAQAIPLPVLGAILVVMAVKMVDIWSLELSRKPSALSDTMVLWLVTAVTVAVDLIIAVGLGLVLAALLYVRRQTILGAQTKILPSGRIRSRVVRSPDQDIILENSGKQLMVARVEGSLFFGSSDDLMGQLEAGLQDVPLVVLDISRVVTMDMTGGKMVLDLVQRLKRSGSAVFLGCWTETEKNRRFLSDLGLDGLLEKDRIFSTGDLALEAAEDLLLFQSGLGDIPLILEDQKFWKDSPEGDRRVLEGFWEKMELDPGKVIFRQGDQESSLFFLLEGKVEVLHPESTGSRMALYGPGQWLGLMARMEKSPRAYDARTLTQVVLGKLSDEALDRIQQDFPELHRRLQESWSRQMASRIRRLQEELTG